jgi:adenylate cyclase
MPHGRTPPRPEDAQADAEEWARFFDYFGHATVRRGIRVLSRLPSAPWCEAGGNPFTGFGGWLMRRAGKSPSQKNPRWCQACFEKAPTGGVTLPIGVLFADIRDSTALAETLPANGRGPQPFLLETDAGDRPARNRRQNSSAMPSWASTLPLTADGRYVDAMVSDARTILGSRRRRRLLLLLCCTSTTTTRRPCGNREPLPASRST